MAGKEHDSGISSGRSKKYIGREITLGIRPEDMHYVESEESDGFSATITMVEPLGADTHLWLSTGTQSFVVRTEPHYEFKIGEMAQFMLRMDKARYFDKETELAILPGPAQ